MAPIKVGFIGLTSPLSEPNSGTGWAVTAHLNYLQNNGGKYVVVALLNSSKEKAEAARDKFELGNGVKCYGDPEEFAADPNIDLVVCSVRVDRHYLTTKPSILAGKDAFIEWPLGANLKEAQELLTLANQKKVKTAIALQGKFSPVVEKVKEFIDTGKIGKVLSSTFVGHAGNGGPTVPEVVGYIADRKVGGNLLTIHFAHTIEYVFYVLGEFKNWNSVVANQRPIVDIVGKEGQVVEKGVKKTTPDQMLVQGTTTTGAVVSYHLRESTQFPNTPRLDWRIYGDKGEIRVTSSSCFLNVGSDDAKITFAATGSEEVEDVEVGKDEWESLAMPGRNIARLYEAFAAGKKGDEDGAYRDFEYAVERHKMIEKMYERLDAEQAGAE